MAEKTKNIHVTNVPERLLKEAKKKAVEEDRPLTEVIRELLEKWVKEGKADG